MDANNVQYSADSMYKRFKEFSFDMYHNTRCHYPNDPGNSMVEPDNYNFRYLMLIYARPLQQDATADRWECNVMGTTTFTDV